MVVPRFVDQALSGRPVTVYGDGQQTRTFNHVCDAVRAILGLAECDRAIGGIFNVGGRERISIEGLAHFVKDLLGSRSEIIHVPYNEAYEEGFEDMQKRVPDISKIRELIGFEPQLSLKQIILDVAEYQRSGISSNGVPRPSRALVTL